MSRRGRVLIVDDEPYILRILSFKLRREGYLTLEATSAEEARGCLDQHQVDLVLLDVSLATPISGFDLAEQLRADPRTAALPIVMLTAHGLASDVLRGRQIGAAGYITKPFSIDEVLGRIDAILSPPA